jgi:hypothetical protein
MLLPHHREIKIYVFSFWKQRKTAEVFVEDKFESRRAFAVLQVNIVYMYNLGSENNIIKRKVYLTYLTRNDHKVIAKTKSEPVKPTIRWNIGEIEVPSITHNARRRTRSDCDI